SAQDPRSSDLMSQTTYPSGSVGALGGFGAVLGGAEAGIGQWYENNYPAQAGPNAGTSMTVDQNGNPITNQDATAILSQELTSWGFGQDAVDWASAQIQ